ncbi:MAG: oxidoreductase [Bacillaceae bacterium]|nr:oxidoreductase [Bacillaceae bacterium]
MRNQESIRVVIQKIIQETRDVKRFILTSPDRSLPSFGAGAHIELLIPWKGKTLNRHYSLINHPLSLENKYEIAVKKQVESRGGSFYLHEHAQEGDVLWIRPPSNHFPLHFEARHHVFYAGGIGITPFLSMMKHLTDLNKSFELHYFAPSQDDCPFYRLIRETFTEQAHFYFSSREEKRLALQATMDDRPMGTHVYVCGPASMIEDVQKAAKSRGYPRKHIHFERFSSSMVSQDNPFTCRLHQSQKEILVPAGHSLLDVLHEQKIQVPFACRRGICGTCEVEVLEGNILHQDSFLTGEEKKQRMLACVSRGNGRITLNL